MKGVDIMKEKVFRSNKIKTPTSDKILQAIIIVVITVFCVFCLLPFVVVITGAFERELNLKRSGYALYIREFSTSAFQLILKDQQIPNSYKVTIFTTVVGTLLSMLFTITAAYPLSLKKVKYRNVVNFMIYFTMLFGGGLVPTYLLISQTLGLKDNIWVLIWPVMCSAWNIFLMRNFFSGVPKELSESAYIDGANDFTILFKIVLPVSVPGIATISLFYALGYWNQWYNAMLYINDYSKMPLQYLIMDLARSGDALREIAQYTGQSLNSMPGLSLKMATTLVTIGPIVLLYPFVQRYFTSGLTVGAVKG